MFNTLSASFTCTLSQFTPIGKLDTFKNLLYIHLLNFDNLQAALVAGPDLRVPAGATVWAQRRHCASTVLSLYSPRKRVIRVNSVGLLITLLSTRKGGYGDQGIRYFTSQQYRQQPLQLVVVRTSWFLTQVFALSIERFSVMSYCAVYLYLIVTYDL